VRACKDTKAEHHYIKNSAKDDTSQLIYNFELMGFFGSKRIRSRS
jgi:hypothetical protein